MAPKAKISPKKSVQEKKLLLLKKIEENKEVLFGKFTTKVTNVTRKMAWARIFEFARSIEYSMPNDATYEYVRDTIWNNLKRPVTQKLTQLSATGGSPGAHPEFTDVENAVLDIIGRDSAAVVGLPVRETFGIQSEAATSTFSGDFGRHNSPPPNIFESPIRPSSNIFLASTFDDVGETSDSVQPANRFAESEPLASPRLAENLNDISDDRRRKSDDAPTSSSRKKQKKSEQAVFSYKEQLQKIKIEKVKTQISLMQKDELQKDLQNYKLKLEIYEKEIELGINPHKYPLDNEKTSNGQ